MKRQHELLQLNLRPVDEMRGSQSDDKSLDGGNVSLNGGELEDEGTVEGKNMTEMELVEQEMGYLEPVDYTASQEQDSFETMIKKAEKEELDPKRGLENQNM